MKILAIAGEHLASLDSFELRFDRGPLAGAGLFVICGPTGAGKSTLLDAMCLALYDRTPRLSQSKSPLSLLQRGAVRASATVEFSDKQGHRYQARWHIHRARRKLSGDWQETQIELVSLENGESLGSHRKRDTLELIANKIGLGFEQFCRSVLLAQGQFSRFLHETGDERAKLLEVITGGEIYSQLSIQAFRTHKAAVESYEQRRQQLARLSQLSDEQREALRLESKLLERRKEGLERGLAAASALLGWQQERSRRAGEVAQAEATLQQARRAADLAAPLQGELALVERAEAVRPALIERTGAGAAVEKLEAALVTVRLAAESASKQAEAAQRSAAQAAAEAEAAARRFAEAQPLLATAAGLEQQLKAVERERTAAVELHRQTRREHEQRLTARTAARQKCEHEQRELEQLESDLRLARAAADLIQRRAELLKPNHPCPLCGSRVHPLANSHDDGPSLLTNLEEQRAQRAESLRLALEHERQATAAEQASAAQLATVTAQAERLSQAHSASSAELLQLLAGLALPASAQPAPKLDPQTRPREVAELVREVTRAQQLCEQALQKANEALMERKSAAAAAQEALEQRRQQLGEATEARERAEAALLAAMHEAGFDDLKQVAQLLAPSRAAREAQRQKLAAVQKATVEAASQLADRRRRLDELLQQASGEIEAGWRDAMAAAYALLPALDQTEQPTGGVHPDAATCVAELTQAQQQTADQRFKVAMELHNDEQRRAEATTLAAEIVEQRALVDEWAVLSELIGSADGKKFRVFAQGLTLDILLAHANQHLRRLRPRYSLRRKNERMELEMVDHDMGDEARDCATLSGGETFLVSLALALGLSSLAVRNVRVESLFIDEGFGSLDRDSLDSALAMLEDLQAAGQQIGVISHVVELAERVPYRVQVEPNGPGPGKSSVEVIGPIGSQRDLELLRAALPVKPAVKPGTQGSLFSDDGAHA